MTWSMPSAAKLSKNDSIKIVILFLDSSDKLWFFDVRCGVFKPFLVHDFILFLYEIFKTRQLNKFAIIQSSLMISKTSSTHQHYFIN